PPPSAPRFPYTTLFRSEVSSHALEQGRIDACQITAAVFTNLSRDHLDYHGSMAAYAAAKARLFRRSELRLAVVNADDPLARLMLDRKSTRLNSSHVSIS